MTSKYRTCNDDFYDECDEREREEHQCDCSSETSIEKIWKGFDGVRKKMVAFSNIFSQANKEKSNIDWQGE